MPLDFHDHSTLNNFPHTFLNFGFEVDTLIPTRTWNNIWVHSEICRPLAYASIDLYGLMFFFWICKNTQPH